MPAKGRALFDVPISFGPESFTMPADAQVHICTLSNENLFPKGKSHVFSSKSLFSYIAEPTVGVANNSLRTPDLQTLYRQEVPRGIH